MEARGLEPLTYGLPDRRYYQLSYAPLAQANIPVFAVLISLCGGGEETRTPGLYSAIVALYQLSYTPTLRFRSRFHSEGEYNTGLLTCQTHPAFSRH